MPSCRKSWASQPVRRRSQTTRRQLSARCSAIGPRRLRTSPRIPAGRRHGLLRRSPRTCWPARTFGSQRPKSRRRTLPQSPLNRRPAPPTKRPRRRKRRRPPRRRRSTSGLTTRRSHATSRRTASERLLSSSGRSRPSHSMRCIMVGRPRQSHGSRRPGASWTPSTSYSRLRGRSPRTPRSSRVRCPSSSAYSCVALSCTWCTVFCCLRLGRETAVAPSSPGRPRMRRIPGRQPSAPWPLPLARWRTMPRGHRRRPPRSARRRRCRCRGCLCQRPPPAPSPRRASVHRPKRRLRLRPCFSSSHQRRRRPGSSPGRRPRPGRSRSCRRRPLRRWQLFPRRMRRRRRRRKRRQLPSAPSPRRRQQCILRSPDPVGCPCRSL
mmetsp:Transcript_18859/g.65735  ORF Transcript_18859/g.65735 Transcript_18859/m.65735 type:complete len:379 (+) Transcript_18859:1786-2922(+)